MKREFLQNLKVGDQPLPKEVIDAIMEENGHDIENAKKPFADYESVKEQLTAANKQIEEFKGMDIDGVRKAAEEWKAKAEQAEKDAAQRIADMEFDNVLKDAITAAKGKNAKAISALLDVSALKQSKNQADDIKSALEALQKENGYLFGEVQTPPPYAPGAGSQNMGGDVSGVEAAFAALNPGLKLN